MMKRVITYLVFMLAVGVCQAEQVCNTQIIATNPTYQYTASADGTVFDSRTGLTWQRCPLGYVINDSGTADIFDDDVCIEIGVVKFEWQGALQAAESQNNAGGFAGFTDWRIPNIKELASTIEHKCFSPAINLKAFPFVDGDKFWSSTIYAITDVAGIVNFRFGRIDLSRKVTTIPEQLVRLVR